MATNDEQQHRQLHVVFFPYLAPGHLIPVADMAALFASRGVKCSILTTPANAAVIRSAVDGANEAFRDADFVPAIDLCVVPFPDAGLPPGVESVVGVSSLADLDKFLEAICRLRDPFGRFLAERRPDAAVVDSFFLWSADAAAEHGVPRLAFLGTSMFARACTDALLQGNPFGDAPDEPDAVAVLPGLPHRVELRRSQVLDPRDRELEWSYYQQANAADQRSYGEVFNSFAELEPDYVEHYRTGLARRVWLVGPLDLASKGSTAARAGSCDLLPDADSMCLQWLDENPAGSVVYISFGTLNRFSPSELRETARGLQLSGTNFVWVMSQDDADEPEWKPEGFADLVAHGERGLIFPGWAPQKRILNHPAVGGFVTHCGWNSVLEALSAGVPMVTWPRFADQFYNEKLIVEVLKVGLGVGAMGYASKLEVRRDMVTGEMIAGAIRGVMGEDERAEAIKAKVKELGAKARIAPKKGGSSYDSVGQLIDELMARRSSVNV